MIRKVCKACGLVFQQKRTRPQYYCSRQCGGVARRVPSISVSCVGCGVQFMSYPWLPKPRSYCSKACAYANRCGDKSANWKRGSWIDGDGYRVMSLGHNRKVTEHVLIAEKALDRPLKRGEVVHHINGIKNDNRNSNLLVCTSSYHRQLHDRMSRLYQQEHFA